MRGENTAGLLEVTAQSNAIDSLETSLSFTDRSDAMRWKWGGFALHHALYSFSVAALVSGNWKMVSSGGGDDNHAYVQGASGPWYESYKVSVGSGKVPFRLAWKALPAEPPPSRSSRKRASKDVSWSDAKLINFWTALARVQDGHFWMNRAISTKPLVLTDDELIDLYWLTENVRNRLMHFVPGGFYIDVASVKETSLVALNAIRFLVIESNAVLFYDGLSKGNVERTLDQLESRLIA